MEMCCLRLLLGGALIRFAGADGGLGAEHGTKATGTFCALRGDGNLKSLTGDRKKII